METKNAKFNRDKSIDVEINHPVHGWIPFTASLEDVEDFGRSLYSAVKGKAAKYVKVAEPTRPATAVPDFKAAIQALIDGNLLAAQIALDKTIKG